MKFYRNILQLTLDSNGERAKDSLVEDVRGCDMDVIYIRFSRQLVLMKTEGGRVRLASI